MSAHADVCIVSSNQWIHFREIDLLRDGPMPHKRIHGATSAPNVNSDEAPTDTITSARILSLIFFNEP